MGNLFSTSTALSKAVDHSAFLNGKTIHVPNAGHPATITRNPTTFPRSVSSRTDVDLSYDIPLYTIDPIRIGRAEEVELSYNKRESVAAEARMALSERVAIDIIDTWAKAAKSNITAKKGEDAKVWIKAVAKNFDDNKVPAEGRYIMLSTKAYYEFLDTLSSNEAFAFTQCADPANGIVGKYFGFEFVKEFLLPTGYELLAWHKQSVSVAKSEPELFEDEGSATMYGNVISGQVRAGAAIIRHDGKGVAAVKSATA